MAGRRMPLASVPNAANSPLRGPSAIGTKRPRPHAADARDHLYGQPPPSKKLVIEADDEHRRNVLRQPNPNPANAFQRKLEAVRDSRAIPRGQEKPQKPTSGEDVRLGQWRGHYRKIFPSFVFYFESVPEEIRTKVLKQIRVLGAREEKFFSKSVSHVITTRNIPKEKESSVSTAQRAVGAPTAKSQEGNAQMKTINPCLLDRNSENVAPSQEKTRLAFEVALQKKAQLSGQTLLNDVDLRRQAGGQGDILNKARELGIKIWALEKLQRMLVTLFDDLDVEETANTNRQGRTTAAPLRALARDADLGQLLKKEKLNGPADRDLSVLTKDMTEIRGYYVYVHDMDEKTKPAMVREYPVVATKEEGEWPQFRVSGPGRCPFVEETRHKSKQTREDTAPAKKETVEMPAPKTKAATTLEVSRQQRVTAPTSRPVLTENSNMARRAANAAVLNARNGFSKPADPCKIIPAKRANPDGLPNNPAPASMGFRVAPRFGVEPVASGIQPSNITSAIRSQMISSTAAVPGARAGTSKEMQQLKRKVLEKNSAPNSLPSSYLNDVRAAINTDRAQAVKAIRRKPQETLKNIVEDGAESEDDVNAPKKATNVQKKKEKEPKSGYCENCREKFDDFDEHVVSRKHRKFALTAENWTELDSLLKLLVRPLIA